MANPDKPSEGGESIMDAARSRGERDGSVESISTLGDREGITGRLLDALGHTQLTGFVAGVLTLVTALLVGQGLLGTRVALITLAAGGTLALGLYALTSGSPTVLLGGGALLAPAGILVAAALGVGISIALGSANAVGHLAELTVLLLVLGSFGAVTTAVPLGDRTVVRGAFRPLLGTLVPLFVLLLFVVVAITWETAIVFLANLILESPEPLLAIGRPLLAPRGSTALLTFLVYVVGVLYLARSVVGTLPIVNLFPPRRRSGIATHVENIRTQLGRAFLVVGALSLVGYIGALGSGLATLGALSRALPTPLDGIVFTLLTATWIRAIFLTLLGAQLAVLVAERLRRRVRRLSDADLLRLAMPPLGAVLVGFVAAIGASVLVSPASLRSQVPAAVAPTVDLLLQGGVGLATLFVVFASVILLGILVVALAILIRTPIAPDRALGPAFAGTAVFALALLLVLFGGSPALALLAAVVAMVVWDTGEYAVGLREELGVDAVTARGEIVHIVGSLSVGVLALLVAVGIELAIASDLAVPSVPDTALAAGALTLTFLTTVVLISTLRD